MAAAPAPGAATSKEFMRAVLSSLEAAELGQTVGEQVAACVISTLIAIIRTLTRPDGGRAGGRARAGVRALLVRRTLAWRVETLQLCRIFGAHACAFFAVDRHKALTVLPMQTIRAPDTKGEKANAGPSPLSWGPSHLGRFELRRSLTRRIPALFPL